MDTLSVAERSERMSRVRRKNTKPELAVRKLVRDLGFGYRLHAPDLPGRPDLVFRGRRKVIFVHGCFWHSHPDPACKLARAPKSRLDFWGPKLARNRERDQEVEHALIESGWKVLTVWECDLRDRARLTDRVMEFLE